MTSVMTVAIAWVLNRKVSGEAEEPERLSAIDHHLQCWRPFWAAVFKIANQPVGLHRAGYALATSEHKKVLKQDRKQEACEREPM